MWTALVDKEVATSPPSFCCFAAILKSSSYTTNTENAVDKESSARAATKLLEPTVTSSSDTKSKKRNQAPECSDSQAANNRVVLCLTVNFDFTIGELKSPPPPKVYCSFCKPDC